MTYWRYWQLSEPPFGGEVKQPLFRGTTIEEALARIEFLITNRRSAGILLGPSGVGKSSLLSSVVTHPPTGEEVPCLQILRTSMMGLGEGELLERLATRLTGANPDHSASGVWGALVDCFQAARLEGTQTILLLDDAESGSTAAERDAIRLLSANFPVTAIFAINSSVGTSVSQLLFDRADLQIELPAWQESQTDDFLAWTVQRLGRLQPIFTSDSVSKIQELSQGIPRRIVQLADLALVAGAVNQSEFVDAETVEQIAWELPLPKAAA